MELSANIKISTDPIFNKISKVMPEIEWKVHAPLIHKINELKKEIVFLGGVIINEGRVKR